MIVSIASPNENVSVVIIMYSLNSAVTRGLCPAATNHFSDERSYLNRIDTFGHQFNFILGLWIPQHLFIGVKPESCLFVVTP